MNVLNPNISRFAFPLIVKLTKNSYEKLGEFFSMDHPV